MRAVQFSNVEAPLALHQQPTPEPGPGEMLLKVEACGICGSDLHAYQAGIVPSGTVFGHEFAGVVVQVGDGVDTEWQPSDRAISLGAMSCEACDACRAGRKEDCSQIQLIGFTRNGAYSEYVIVQASQCTRIPEALSFSQGALVEPLAVGLAAMRDARLPLGGNVLVIGAGIIGITVAKWARFFGAGNIGISDLAPARLQRALAAGATLAIDASGEQGAVQAFIEATGCEPQVIIECTGRPILQQLIDMSPRDARLVVVGAAMEPEPILSVAATQKKLQMTFSFGYTLEDFEFIVRMIDTDRMRTDGLITATVSLEETPQAFDGLMRPNDHCKVMIEP